MLTAQSPLDMKNISSVGSCCLIMIYSGVANDVPNLPTIDSIICSSFVNGLIKVVAESGLSLLKDL
tara:strand:+ start:95 stop:292 length:198 start_codon:yes stop_codon:yes gene_type:complete